VASLLQSLSPYLPEPLHKVLLPLQQKPPEPTTLLTNLENRLRPAYKAFVQQIAQLLPQHIEEHVPQSAQEQVLAVVRDALVKIEELEPTLVAAFLLTLILLVRLMSSWYNRFGSGWDRLSPFTRGEKSDGQVSDSDFSYITADDLAKVNAGNTSNSGFTPSHDRDTDVLILKHKKVSYPVHFAAHSIDKGALKVGEIRAAAAKKLELDPSQADRIKILYRGKNLKDDARSARDEGLKSSSESELMIVLGDAPPREESESSDDEDEGPAEVGGDGKKKKKNRKRKSKKRRGGDSGTATPNSGYSNANINPDATYAPSGAPPPRPTPSPRPQAVPQTAIEKLDGLSSHFHTKYVPECVSYISNPPADKAKREFDHKRLSETIMMQILLKLDAVETEGNPEARQRRKDLVREVQNMLTKLDEVVKG
jgi:hypothetical protein